MLAASGAAVATAGAGTAARPGATTALQGGCSQNAPVFTGLPPQLAGLSLPRIWQYSRGQGVTVAVIDTGVARSAPQLAAALVPGVDVIGGSTSPIGQDDPNGHGTMVAGIIAARPATGTQVVGLAPAAMIMPIRQGGDQTLSTPDSLAIAIDRAVLAGARVINISEATTTPTPNLARAVSTAIAAGVVIVAAAGNDAAGGTDANGQPIPANAVMYPAAYPGVLAVGAVDQSGQHASFSETGPYLGVTAQGVNMVSTVPGGGDCEDSGTSYATPFVTAVVALVWSAHPNLTARQVVTTVEATADGGGSWNPETGYGVVDPLAALTMIDPPQLQAPPATEAPAFIAPDPTRAQDQATAHNRVLATVTIAIGAAVTLAVLAGTLVMRDATRRRERPTRRAQPVGDVLTGPVTESPEGPS